MHRVALLFISLMAAAASLGQNNAVLVKKEPPQSALRGIGVVMYRKVGGGYILQPRKGLAPEQAAAKLRAQGLDAVATHAIIPAAEVKPAEKGYADYLENYNAWVKLRAYPYLSPDPDQVRLAGRQRDKMPPFWMPGSGPKAINGTWQCIGPTNLPTPYRQYFGNSPLSGRVNGCAIDSTNSNILYIAAACGGVWKSVDGGANWNFLSQNWQDLHTSCVTIDPTNHNTIYVGTGDFVGDQRGVTSAPYGIQKSTDGGVTWNVIGNPWLTAGQIISTVWVNPGNGFNLLAGTDQGIYRSIDGGTTWTNVASTTYRINTLIKGMPRSSAPSYYMYASGFSGALNSGVILRSGDGGVSWSQLSNPGASNLAQFIAASRVSPDTLYLLDIANQRIWKSTNAGANWFNTTNNLPTGNISLGSNYNWSQRNYDAYIATSARGAQDVVYVSLIDLCKSIDGGANWSSIGGATYDPFNARIHNDQHALATNTANNADALVANDGGVYRYNETTDAMTPLNARMTITQFYTADWSNTNANFALGGTQDNATPFFNNGTWNNVGGGDGGASVVDYTNNAVMFVTSNGAISKTDTTWTFSGGQGIPWNTNEGGSRKMYMDPNDHSKIYVLGFFVYRINNVFLGGSDRLGGPNDSSGLNAIAVANGDSNRIYTGGAGTLWRSTNAGTSWTNIAGSTLPNAYVTDISVDPNNENSVVVCLAGGGIPHVYQCTNTMAATPVWTPINGLPSQPAYLPDVAANCMARDPYTPWRIFYVGTDVGVFVTVDAGAHWYNATVPLGMPNAPITAMKATPSTGFLNVATFGRGMWRLPLASRAVGVYTFYIAPNPIYEGRRGVGNITLTQAMPYPGDNVSVTTANPSNLTVPSSVFVAAGATTATFTVTPRAISSVINTTVTASYGGLSATTNVTLRPSFISYFTNFPILNFAGNLVLGRFGLFGIPQTGGFITLVSQSKNLIVPASQKFGAQSQYVDVWMQTLPIDQDTPVSVVASYNGASFKATFTLYAAQVASVSSDAPKYTGSSKGSLTIQFTSPIGPSGANVYLTSAPAGIINLPKSVFVQAGATQTNVVFTTNAVQAPNTVTVTATTTGDTKGTSFIVNP